MVSVADRRQSIYQAITSIENWNPYPYLIGAPVLPALMVGAPSEGDLDETLDGAGSYVFTVYAVCSGTDWQAAQQLIDPLLALGDSGSLRAALDAEAELAGQITGITFSDYGPGATWANVPVFMARVRLEILS